MSSFSQLVLVTGGAGFIGSHLVMKLLESGYRVRVLDNLCTGHLENLRGVLSEIEFVEADASDFEVCRNAVSDATYVLHQAAIPSVPRSVKEPLSSHVSGPTATLNLLEASRLSGSVQRLVFAASSSAYGDTDELPKHEAMVPNPLSPYAASKLAGEMYVRCYGKTMGLDTVSLRYFNIFGPRQDPNSPYSGVIAKFSKVMKQGERPIIFGDGSQSRDFTYIDNAVHANLLSMLHPERLEGDVFNVGTGTQTDLVQLVACLNDILKTDLSPIFEPERRGDVKHSLASLSKITNRFGFKPIVDFQEGLKRTVSYEK
ncbi:MAG: SDR family oxidoreductase [bacterium]